MRLTLGNRVNAAFVIGFATGRIEVDYYYWGFLPIFTIVVAHDAYRMLLAPIPGADR